jgi:hypothetical protein
MWQNLPLATQRGCASPVEHPVRLTAARAAEKWQPMVAMQRLHARDQHTDHMQTGRGYVRRR